MSLALDHPNIDGVISYHGNESLLNMHNHIPNFVLTSF